MTEPSPRPFQQRKQDTLARLSRDVDAWVATAGRDLMRDGRWLA